MRSLRQNRHGTCCPRFVASRGGQTDRGMFSRGGFDEVGVVGFERREAWSLCSSFCSFQRRGEEKTNIACR